MHRLLRDAAFAARNLTHTPGFTLVVVLTLALGIGGNSAIFSLVNAMLLRPIRVAQPDRLAVVWESRLQEAENYMFASPPNYADWRDENRTFEALSAYSPRDFFLQLETETARIHGARVSASLFPVLGVAPRLGRSFVEEEDRPGGGRVAVISDRLWRTRYGADPDIVGGSITVDDEIYTLVGVMPADFHFPPPLDLEGRISPRQNDIWVPLALDLGATSRAAHFLTVIGRLRQGMDLTSAEADMRDIAARLAQEHPATNAQWSIRVVPFERVILGDVRLALIVLLGAVGVVLLIACVNVANLLLTRSAGRQKEYAIRAALGANRWQLVRHAIVESQLLALTGGVAGLLLAAVGVNVLLRIAPANLPRLGDVRVDAAVVAYTLGVSVLTGLLFGLAPALRTFTPNLAGLLKTASRGSAGGSAQSRLRSVLVVAEVALSLMLLVGAGLLFNSFLALRGVETGVRSERVLTMRTTLGAAQYPEAARVAATYRELESRVNALPGIEAAGFALDVPLASDYQGTAVTIEGEAAPAQGEEPRSHFSIATPGFFDALGIPLRAGRLFREEDTADSAPVIMVNEVFVAMYFGGREPLGRRIVFGGEPRIVIGVVGDVRLETLTADPTPALYLPHAQVPGTRAMSLIARARRDPAEVASAVREAILGVDRGIPVYDVKTMRQILAESLAQSRFSAVMLLLFSAVALALAGVGMYGVISFAVGQQTREIGIRMALGARPADELRRVVGGGARLIASGVALGLLGALASAYLLRSLLFEVQPADPLTLSTMTLFVIGVGLLACVIPALRASRVEPLRAMHYE